MVVGKGIIKQSIDVIATTSDSGGLPDFSSPMNNFHNCFYIAAILAVVTFGQNSGKYYLFMVRGLQQMVHIPLLACILPSRLMFYMA